MQMISDDLHRKVKAISGSYFTMGDFYKGCVIFRNRKLKHDDFTLFYEKLSDDQILEIVKILVNVYKTYSPDIQNMEFNYSPVQRSLNYNTDYSEKFLSTVLKQEKDALHKLLLLTSGNKFLEASNVDLMCELAVAKKDWDGDYSLIFMNSARYIGLKDHYILPGVFQGTIIPNNQGRINESFEKESLASSLCLLAFLSNDSESVTLKSHFTLEFSEAIRTNGSLFDFRAFENATALMRSEYYSDLPMDMTARELEALSKILMSSADHKFPKDVLINRSRAMASKEDRRELSGPGSIWRYMSDDEVESLKAGEKIDEINSALSGLSFLVTRPPVIYAMFAEVFAVKGEQQTMLVCEVIKNVKSLMNCTEDFYSALVNLVAEILKPENDGFPFSWIAQMSDHSWVLDYEKV